MDSQTGRVFASLAAALAAGVPEERIVTGHPKALRKLVGMVKSRNKRNRERRRKRKLQAASRKRNRRS